MSLTLNGSTQYLTDAAPPVSALPFTVSAWVKLDSLASVMMPIFLGNTGSAAICGITLNPGGNPGVAWGRADNSASVAQPSNTVTAGAWAHVAATFASDGGGGTDITCVVNGDWDARGILAGGPAIPTIARWDFGSARDSSPGFYVDGKIAEWALWGAALGQSDIESLAAGTPAAEVAIASLASYLPLDTATLVDAESGNTWVATGSPTFDLADHPPIGITSTVTLNDLPDLRVYQCAADNQLDGLAISGTYTPDSGGNPPDAIWYRFVAHGTDTPIAGHDWAELDPAPAGGVFLGVVDDVPAGGWYNVDVEARWPSETAQSLGANRFAVGDLYLVIIPSAARDFFQVGTSYVQTETGAQYTGTTDAGETLDVWAPAAASGCRKLIDTIASATGRPVGLIKAGVGGSALVYTGASGGYWTNLATGQPWDRCLEIMDAVGDTLAGIVFFVGANDAAPGTISEAAWEAGFATLRTRIAAEFAPGRGMAEIPLFVMETGRGTLGDPPHSDVGFHAIRSAAADVVEAFANVHHGAVLIDQALTDGIHLDEAGNLAAAERVGHAIRAQLGETAIYPGPRIRGYSLIDTTTTRVHLAQGAGTDFTPTSGIGTFSVELDGVGWVSATGARVDATAIDLTHAAGSVVNVRHGYGANPGIGTLVKDNSALTLPIWPTGDVPVLRAAVLQYAAAYYAG